MSLYLVLGHEWKCDHVFGHLRRNRENSKVFTNFQAALYEIKCDVRMYHFYFKLHTILVFSTGAFTAVIMWKNRKPKKMD